MDVVYAYYVSTTGAQGSEQTFCACGVAVRVDGEGKLEEESAEGCGAEGGSGRGSEAGGDGYGRGV